ncbi:metalloregulator ArsR/SmtB family transcription factor [Streptomyces sp. NPDC001941]|uniref:ArsR/SmtB family transcription factor n=1 Tax=Streptomyces sp. NPDC001941 TaxID=3154659 RepID=UPI00332B36DF
MTGYEEGLDGTSRAALEEAAAVFGLLGSPVRLRILQVLARGESSVAHIAERVGGAMSTVSQHLSALRLSGLVGARREGRRQVYFLEDPGVVEVVQVMVGQLALRAELRPDLARGPGRGDA